MTGSYRTALLDWLACARAGRHEHAARAATTLGDEVVAAGTAGHVLDFDDTYAPGLAHLSAPTAPAALVVGASIGASLGDVLAAYAAGFEVMGALSAANHPGLRERGWHPTAVCGAVGAAVAAARLLEANEVYAAELALVQASGLQAAFGGDGKSLQVGLAAAAGVRAARLGGAGGRAGDGGGGGGGGRGGGTAWSPDSRPPTGRVGRWPTGAARSTRTGSRPIPAACRRTRRSRRP